MKKSIFFALIFGVNFIASSSYAEKQELAYPNAINKLVIDTEQSATYSKLAKTIGFDINKRYTYSEYSRISRENKVGIAGAYDFLLLSTGGNGWDYEAVSRMNKEKCGWEMNYYSNHNLTVIHEVCHDDSRTYSFVRILKLGKGKNTKLNMQ